MALLEMQTQKTKPWALLLPTPTPHPIRMDLFACDLMAAACSQGAGVSHPKNMGAPGPVNPIHVPWAFHRTGKQATPCCPNPVPLPCHTFPTLPILLPDFPFMLRHWPWVLCSCFGCHFYQKLEPRTLHLSQPASSGGGGSCWHVIIHKAECGIHPNPAFLGALPSTPVGMNETWSPADGSFCPFSQCPGLCQVPGLAKSLLPLALSRQGLICLVSTV